VLQSTPRRGARPASQVKDMDDIHGAWKTILSKRREFEPDDQKEISSRDQLAEMWNQWSAEWCSDNLTEEQQWKKEAQKTSIFNAYVFKNFGSKHFVMALWQTGVTWAPSHPMVEANSKGAAEHVAKALVRWIERFMVAVAAHKAAPATVTARIRSGGSTGRHGLTAEEWYNRAERDRTRRDYWQTLALEDRLLASKGKGAGKRGAVEHAPKTWEEMSWCERWWLEELWSGRLRYARDQAEGKMQRIQADDFRT